MRLFLSSACLGAVALAALSGAAQAQGKDLRWATSSTGSSGHRALVSLSQVLNDKLDDYSITVLPTPGAAASVRGFAAGQFDGYYGADVAFHEIADNGGRYEGFADEEHENQLVQSFWAYTLEVGLGVREGDKGDYECWKDLSGHPVFTAPAPWDTRAALERAMDAVGADHEYVEVDLGLAGQALQEGTIDGLIVYTAGQSSPSPWVQEALLTTDVAVINPCDDEMAALKEAGIPTVKVSNDVFDADIGVDEATFVPFFYGFHLGMNVSEDDVYNILTTIEENVDALAEADPSFSQVKDDLVGMQVRGIEATGDAIPIHPGLAKFLKEHDAWNSDWDGNVAG